MKTEATFHCVAYRPDNAVRTPGLLAETLAACMVDRGFCSPEQIRFKPVGSHGAPVWGDIAGVLRTNDDQWVIRAWHITREEELLEKFLDELGDDHDVLDDPTNLAGYASRSSESFPDTLPEDEAYRFRLVMTLEARKAEISGFLPKGLSLPLPADPNTERLSRLKQCIPWLKRYSGRLAPTFQLWEMILGCPVTWQRIYQDSGSDTQAGRTAYPQELVAGNFDDGLPCARIQIGPVLDMLYEDFKPGGAVYSTLHWLICHSLPLDLNFRIHVRYSNAPDGLILPTGQEWLPIDISLPFYDLKS